MVNSYRVSILYFHVFTTMRILEKIVQKSINVCSKTINQLWRQKNLSKCRLVKPGKLSPERHVPQNILKPEYYSKLMDPGNTCGIPEVKTLEQIEKMRLSCKLAANILKSCNAILQIGITTDEIDAYVHDKIISVGAYPSPLRYAGFPKSICTSVNNVACHGIPDDQKLMDGDIINIDITVYLNGYHGDCSKTYLIGNVDERGRYLVKECEECLNKVIEECKPGAPFNSIGNFIQQYIEAKNLNCIPDFVGHGIGQQFHGPPEIYHFGNQSEGIMIPGNIFTIEPILTLGAPFFEILEDGWTAVTLDGARTAQFEHTILITENGYEILTIPD